jgi:hypothetical protein
VPSLLTVDGFVSPEVHLADYRVRCAGVSVFGNTLTPSAMAAPAQNGPSPYGPLQAASANGIQLPAGFTSRIIARSGQQVAGTGYVWHSAPDGGAVFADGSGWIYVSNSEITGPFRT